MTNKETGVSRTAQTDDLGRYSMPNLPAGIYEMKVTAAGFKTYTVSGVEITINTAKAVDARLEVGAVNEQVVVEASAAVLKTEKADVGAEISGKTVQDLPLPAYRNYQTLINLVPGATPAAFQNAVVDTPGRALTTNINGTNRNNNNTRVDGATNVFIWLPHHTVYVQPVESIEQVNITTGSMDAEQGMAGGAAITVSTKSGTNDFHGVGFWYHQNQKLKARHFFDRIDRLPMANMNIFGGTLGGPIKKNKLFFFGSFERTTERSGQVGEYSVPTQDVRNGNFSGLTGLALIYDPATGSPDGTGRQAFPNNVIPASRISSIWRSIQELAPLPNRPATDAFGLQQNFTASGTFKLDRNNYDFKSNWNVNEKLMVWGKYSRMDAPVTGLVPFGPLVGPAVGAASPGNGDTTVQIPTVGFNYVLSPTMFVDGVFGYTRFDQTVTGLDFGTNWGLERFRIPGTNGGARFANDLRYSGMPVFNHGFSTWGQTATWIPLVRNDRSYTYTTNFSKLQGRHELRWGIDIVRHAMNHWQPETANPRGNITFGGNATMIPGGVAQSINSYAAALLGQITAYSKSVQYFLMQTREWQYGFYFRDRWQVTRNLTLNLGLRYEYYPLMHRGDRGLERWDPATNQVFLGGLGNIPRNAGISTNEGLFAPRLGLAYKVGDNTVFRVGYGLTPNPLPFSRPLRGLYPATITASGAAATQFAVLSTLDRGIPEVPLPDVTSGVLTLPRGLDMGPRSPWSTINRGYIQSWNFTIQRKLPASFTTSLAYVGTQTTRQLGDRDINAAPPGGDQAGRPFFTRNGPIALNMWDGFASGNYHAFQFQLDRQFTGGLFVKNSYTWSKTINMFDDDGWVGLPITNWEPAIRRNRALAGYDRPHMWVSAFSYDLPFGSGQKMSFTNKAANFLFGGWKTNGSFSAYSGTPFTVTAAGISLNAPGSTQTADQVGEIKKVGGIGPGTFYYDPASFRDPNIGRPANVFRFGTMGRNALRGPGFWRIDASMFKTFRIGEKVNMEFKSEVYNLTNTARFNNPQANVSQQVTNQVTGVVSNINNFMAITTADRNQDRQFRFGLRLSF
jgi:outer membrane receptor protein involved in Fe transport